MVVWLCHIITYKTNHNLFRVAKGFNPLATPYFFRNMGTPPATL
jgi:hypothetical protein